VGRPGIVLVLACLGLLCRPARAHDLRGTLVLLDFDDSTVDAELQVPLDQIGLALDWPLAGHPGEVAAHAEALAAYLQQHLRATAPDGRPFRVGLRHVAVQRIDDGEVAVARAVLQAPRGASARVFELGYDAIVHRVVTHNIYVFARRDLRAGLLGDRPELLGLMHFQSKVLAVDRGEGSRWRALEARILLGARRVAAGAGPLHLRLLLLLPAALILGWWLWRRRRLAGGTGAGQRRPRLRAPASRRSREHDDIS
jgi:hypothetical protein